jgi:hypothetical protein
VTAAAVIAGCGVQFAGSAAVIGDERITEKQLSAQVEELVAAFGEDVQAPTSEQVSRAILARLIVDQIVIEAAAAEDISVSDSQVAQERVAIEEALGGETSLLQFAANQGLPPSMIEGALRTNLLITQLGQKLSPGVEPALQQEVAFSYVSEFANSLNVEVSPRIGVWVAADFSIAPPPNDLSVPVD